MILFLCCITCNPLIHQTKKSCYFTEKKLWKINDSENERLSVMSNHLASFFDIDNVFWGFLFFFLSFFVDIVIFHVCFHLFVKGWFYKESWFLLHDNPFKSRPGFFYFLSLNCRDINKNLIALKNISNYIIWQQFILFCLRGKRVLFNKFLVI